MASRNFKMLVLFITVLSFLKLSLGFDYSDLMAMNASCPPRDTCKSNGKGPRLDDPYDWQNRNCFCDDVCADYGDCCLDANAYVEEEQIKNRGNYECVPLTQFGTLYMKSKCSGEWDDQYIAEMCTRATSQKHNDPMAEMPVTSLNSFITYKNYYCAICNEDSSALEVWKSHLDCDTLQQYQDRFKNLTENYVASNLVYDGNNWGIYIVTDEAEVFHTCQIYPSMPPTVTHMVRNCVVVIKNCSLDWVDETTRNLCYSYTAVRYHDQAFRNSHCALCNELPIDDLSCYSKLGRKIFWKEFNYHSFALLLDFSDGSGSNIVGSSSTCKRGEVFDPFFKKCRSVICGRDNQEYRAGRCIDLETPNIPSPVSTTSGNTQNISSSNSTVKNQLSKLIEGRTETPMTIHSNISSEADEDSIETDVTPVTEVVMNVSSTLSSHENTNKQNSTTLKKPSRTLPCERFLLPNEEYTMNDNGTVVVEKYERTYQISEYEPSDGGILVCIIQNETEKFSKVMGWVTLAGLGLSCICLLLHLLAFLIVPDLRNLSGKNLASLCLILLGAFATFILSIFGEPDKTDCFILAISMYYFFLASFCWVNVMAFDVWRTLSLATTELRVSAGSQWCKFTVYSIYGWLLPGAVVISVVVLDLVRPAIVPSQYYPAFGEYWCWFGHRKALLVFFAAPLMAIMILNIILFIMSARIIADTMDSTAKMTSCSPYQNQFKLYMRLALLMGLTWISGIVAGYLQMEVIWYIFVLLNTLQGFFIFVAFTCTRKVWHALRCGCCKNVSRGHSWVNRSHSSSKQGLQSTNSNVSNLSQTSNSPFAHNTSSIRAVS